MREVKSKGNGQAPGIVATSSAGGGRTLWTLNGPELYVLQIPVAARTRSTASTGLETCSLLSLEP
jgi:hypothetical protein